MKLPPEKTGLIVDRRWEGNTGIGRYSRELISRISTIIDGFIDGGIAVSPKQMVLTTLHARHFKNFYSPGYVPLLANKCQVITIHDLILLKPEIVGARKSFFFNKILLPMIRDGIIRVNTVSELSQKEIAEWADIDREHVFIVPNGLSNEILAKGKNIDSIKPAKSLVFVGNMKIHKNFRLFVDAVNLLPGSWEINIVGPKMEIQLIHGRHQVKSYSNIPDIDLAEIYSKSSILVNTSTYEGFGMPILEGGYLGCKVVHLGVLHTVEEILGADSFHTGGSHSPIVLAELINQVSQENQGHAVREYLAKKYSWDLSGNLLKNMLSNL